MYLPDPRTEVVVKRQLSDKECGLLYPGNTEVLAYNRGITDEKISKMANRGEIKSITDAINSAYSTSNQEATLAIFEANANISRGVSYTKPRTITLDTKYDGVVSVDVWTGYAVNVISKSGKREVVVGPATRLLDYDETLEAVTLSTGTPKNHNNTINTAYLRVENNKVSDAITVQTKDFVNVMLNVSFCVNFLEKYKDKWFAVDNYIKLLCDRARSILKNEAKKYSIEEFYSNAINIVRKAILTEGEGKSKSEGRTFMENGMQVYDVEVLGIKVEESVAKIIVAHQEEMVRKALELSDAAKKMEVTTQLDTYAKETAKLTHETELYRLGLSKALEKEKADAALELAEAKRQMEIAKVQAEAAIQTSYDTIASAKLAREKAVADAEIAKLREQAQIEIEKNKAQAERIKEVMESITPELVAAMTSSANADLMETVTKSMAPYAIANGESVSDVTNRLLRGTPLEGLLQQLVEKK
jgi:major vault protein